MTQHICLVNYSHNESEIIFNLMPIDDEWFVSYFTFIYSINSLKNIEQVDKTCLTVNIFYAKHKKNLTL